MTVDQQIKNDLAAYFISNSVTDATKGVENLRSLLTPAIMQNNNITDATPVNVQAWIALQIFSNSPMRYHSSAILGTFIYDSRMYSVQEQETNTLVTYYRLHYNSDCGLKPVLPEGCSSCVEMFAFCKLPDNFSLDDSFYKANIMHAHNMFCGCTLPSGFVFPMYKTKEELLNYVKELQSKPYGHTVKAEKKGIVIAREAKENEELDVYTKNGNFEGHETAQKGDMILTRANDDGTPYVDDYSHINSWKVSRETFEKKYDTANPIKEGVYKPASGVQLFIQINDDISFDAPWGERQNIRTHGYLNITDLNDLYGIAEEEFKETYKYIE